MMLNNFIYFAIWIIFFQRFKEVRGWGISDMYITYGVLAERVWTGGLAIWQRVQFERDHQQRTAGLLSLPAASRSAPHDCQPDDRERDGRFYLRIPELCGIRSVFMGWIAAFRTGDAFGCYRFRGVPDPAK